MKRIITLTLTFAILTLTSPTADAHYVSQERILEQSYIGENYDGYYVGNEEWGWHINEDYHCGRQDLSVAVIGATDDEIAAIETATQMWRSMVTFTFTQGICDLAIKVSDSGDNGIAGMTLNMSSPSEIGHVEKWGIIINSRYTTTSTLGTVVAHELGHVIGLTDLYRYYNRGSIMYYTAEDWTATGPTYSDFQGAMVILGVHTTHNFDGIRYWGSDTNGNHYHVQYCSECNGSRPTKTQCSFSPIDPFHRCVTCGYSEYLAP